ncbi:MAG TPA: hypothetical protein VFZ00_20505 [Solirubrobacter sp.]|nr:hypothetical protein [Solirubrobacter sp.]
MTLRRDWLAAQDKRAQGCRVCGNAYVELAHVIGRARDERRGKVAVVNKDSVVPLCREHHQMYDAHRLDLMGVLTVSEQAQAVLDAGGLELARRRISGRRAA